MDSNTVVNKTAENVDKQVAKEKRAEAKEARKAIRGMRKNKMDEVKGNQQAYIDLLEADNKDNILETPQDPNYGGEDQQNYKEEMQKIKKYFREEKKQINGEIKCERMGFKEKYGKPPRTEDEEKEFLEQKILKQKIKYYKKFGQAPKDLFSEYEKNGKLQELLSKHRDDSTEKNEKNTADAFAPQENKKGKYDWQKHLKN